MKLENCTEVAVGRLLVDSCKKVEVALESKRICCLVGNQRSLEISSDVVVAVVGYVVDAVVRVSEMVSGTCAVVVPSVVVLVPV